ncbi:MAG TPA: phosphatase PAP2 family protein [Rhodanobacteraceae bacterium]|nr:phosphatase PAP2 family protein [Rhodanobacteraceae bacterium]
MDRRFLLGAALIAAVLMTVGFLGADRPLAEWVHASGIANARFFDWGLYALDTVSGMRFWIFAIGWIAIVAGAIELRSGRRIRLGHTLLTAGIVQLAALETMVAGKDFFGRHRPYEVLASGDWTQVWFAGGGSFPSGHSAFYFGLLLPLAAACPIRWLRYVLVAIPVYVVLARIDLEKHFLSDVSASALMVALYALFAAWLTERWLPAPKRA